MEVMKEMLVQSGREGIKEVEDLTEFNRDIWKQVAENLKHRGGRMKNLDKDANTNHALVPQTLFLFGARMQKRLLEVSKLMKYCKM
eukprot:12678617-Ditylum_brightwellii.AAC.1